MVKQYPGLRRQTGVLYPQPFIEGRLPLIEYWSCEGKAWHQTANNKRATKKPITTTAFIALTLVAGSQSAEQHTEVLDAQYTEAVQAGVATFWKQAALRGGHGHWSVLHSDPKDQISRTWQRDN